MENKYRHLLLCVPTSNGHISTDDISDDENTKRGSMKNIYKEYHECIANKNVSQYVQEKKPFLGNNLDGFWLNTHLYVVLSYDWYPIYIYDTRVAMWYMTNEYYSTTTARHMRYAQPKDDTITCSKQRMQQLIRGEI